MDMSGEVDLLHLPLSLSHDDQHDDHLDQHLDQHSHSHSIQLTPAFSHSQTINDSYPSTINLQQSYEQSLNHSIHHSPSLPSHHHHHQVENDHHHDHRIDQSINHSLDHSSIRVELTHSSIDHSLDHSSINHSLDHSSINHSLEHSSINHSLDHSSINHSLDHSSINHSLDHSSINHSLDHDHSSINHSLDHAHSTINHSLNHDHSPINHSLNHDHSPINHSLNHDHSPISHSLDHNHSSINHSLDHASINHSPHHSSLSRSLDHQSIDHSLDHPSINHSPHHSSINHSLDHSISQSLHQSLHHHALDSSPRFDSSPQLGLFSPSHHPVTQSINHSHKHNLPTRFPPLPHHGKHPHFGFPLPGNLLSALRELAHQSLNQSANDRRSAYRTHHGPFGSISLPANVEPPPEWDPANGPAPTFQHLFFDGHGDQLAFPPLPLPLPHFLGLRHQRRGSHFALTPLVSPSLPPGSPDHRHRHDLGSHSFNSHPLTPPLSFSSELHGMSMNALPTPMMGATSPSSHGSQSPRMKDSHALPPSAYSSRYRSDRSDKYDDDGHSHSTSLYTSQYSKKRHFKSSKSSSSNKKQKIFGSSVPYPRDMKLDSMPALEALSEVIVTVSCIVETDANVRVAIKITDLTPPAYDNYPHQSMFHKSNGHYQSNMQDDSEEEPDEGLLTGSDEEDEEDMEDNHDGTKRRKRKNLSSRKSRLILCPDCSQEFPNEVDMYNHLASSHGRHVCPNCQQNFEDDSRLKMHLSEHSRGRQHVCTFCGEGFTQSGHCKEHERIHTGEKPFVCPVIGCERGFSRNSYLKQHARIHTGEKRFICDQCDKGFRQSSTLKSHKRIHTGEKPYSCPLCGKTFRHGNTRKAHMISEHGQQASNHPALSVSHTEEPDHHGTPVKNESYQQNYKPRKSTHKVKHESSNSHQNGESSTYQSKHSHNNQYSEQSSRSNSTAAMQNGSVKQSDHSLSSASSVASMSDEPGAFVPSTSTSPPPLEAPSDRSKSNNEPMVIDSSSDSSKVRIKAENTERHVITVDSDPVPLPQHAQRAADVVKKYSAPAPMPISAPIHNPAPTHIQLQMNPAAPPMQRTSALQFAPAASNGSISLVQHLHPMVHNVHMTQYPPLGYTDPRVFASVPLLQTSSAPPVMHQSTKDIVMRDVSQDHNEEAQRKVQFVNLT